ncbi:MAG TPA: hypothetical protein VM869_04520 [Enhygromyxa sp.]|nr:hypothetical protein [Enhygromyxa sp.]
MKLRDCLRISLTTLCLLAPLTMPACTDDGGGNEANESETGDGDGDGDPGDGDGDPGDGDGDPGDGDGDPGDGDGDPGDGDGDPGDGDGDGEPGDGDGDPGTCDAMDATWGPEDCFNPRGWFWDGDACQQIFCTCEGTDCDSLFADEAACLAEYDECLFGDECAPFDAQGVGPCEAFFGVTWTGDNCVGVSGCECQGTDCDNLYEDSEQCWSDHALCELGDPCAKDDAIGVGPCDAFFGYAWNGLQCEGVSGCQCEGPDCANLPQDLAECEAAHAECLPPDGCAGLDKAECMADNQCMPINGAELVKEEDDWCSMPQGFLGCDEEAVCLQVFTWGCGPFGEVAEFPSSCLPPGWSPCDPPVVNAPPC